MNDIANVGIHKKEAVSYAYKNHTLYVHHPCKLQMYLYYTFYVLIQQLHICKKNVYLHSEVTKRVYFIGNERMLIAHDSNRLRFS